MNATELFDFDAMQKATLSDIARPVSQPDKQPRMDEKTLARKSDPATSKAAAKRVKTDLGLHGATGNSQTSGTGDICAAKHKGNEFSVAANPSHKAKVSEQKLILEALGGRYIPLTCEQLEDKTGLSHQSASARITELKRAGKIVKAGIGTTRSGRSAAAYLLK